MNRNAVWLVAPALVCLVGCVDVNGGAVELSWTIQDTRGDRRACDDGPLGAVRLRGIGPGGVTWVSADVECDAHRLASRFEIEPGRWAFSLEASCVGGQVASVQVPDPIARDIVTGQVAQLNALLIVIQSGRGSCRVTPDAMPAVDAPPIDALPLDGAALDAAAMDATPDATPIERRAN